MTGKAENNHLTLENAHLLPSVVTRRCVPLQAQKLDRITERSAEPSWRFYCTSIWTWISFVHLTIKQQFINYISQLPYPMSNPETSVVKGVLSELPLKQKKIGTAVLVNELTFSTIIPNITWYPRKKKVFHRASLWTVGYSIVHFTVTWSRRRDLKCCDYTLLEILDVFKENHNAAWIMFCQHEKTFLTDTGH